MKILLDECIDRRLAKEFVEHEIRIVPQKFEVFITVDRNLSFQQNLPQFDIVVIVLQAPSNRLADLKPLIPKVLALLATVAKGQASIIGT